MQTKAILLIRHSIFRLSGLIFILNSQGRIVKVVGGMDEFICDMYAFFWIRTYILYELVSFFMGQHLIKEDEFEILIPFSW